MVRVIRKLRIDSVDHVTRGAGIGCVTLIRKVDDDAALADMIAQVRREFPGIDDADAKMFARVRLRSRNGLDKQGLAKMTNEESFSEWWSSLDASERKAYRRLQSLLDEQMALDERAARQQEWTTPPSQVHGNEQPTLSANERRGYGSGRQKRADSLRKIASDHGLIPLCKHLIEDGPHGFDENQLAECVQDYADRKGVPVTKLWAGDSEESRLICKAASVCRQGEMARAAEQTLGKARVAARAAQLNLT